MSAHPLHLPHPHVDFAPLRAAVHGFGRLLWALFEEAGRQRARHELTVLERRWTVTSPELAQIVRERAAA